MSTEPGGGAPRAQIPNELLQRLEAHDARLAALIGQLTRQTDPRGLPAVAAPVVVGVDAPIEQASGVHESRLGILVAAMVLVATLLTVSVAVFEYNADPNPSSRRGLMASFRRELISVVQVGQLNAQQRAYADSMLNAELARLIRAEIPDVPEAQRSAMLAEAEQATRAAGASSVFFQRRYLNRDGSFDMERQMGEAWSQAARETDIDARAHFLEADMLRANASFLTNLVFWLTMAVCVFELVGNLHPRRRLIRIGSAAAATVGVLLVAALLGMYLIA